MGVMKKLSSYGQRPMKAASKVSGGNVIQGDKELERALKQLRESAAKRAIQKGLNKAAQHGAKAVKASVPSKFKNARRGVGWRALKRRFNNNEPGAKVGAGVGKARAMTEKQAAAQAKRRSSRGGVGITANNIHWLLLGTDERYTGDKKGKPTGKPIMYRGSMPAQVQSVSETLLAEASAMTALIKKNTWAGIEKEVEKMFR